MFCLCPARLSSNKLSLRDHELFFDVSHLRLRLYQLSGRILHQLTLSFVPIFYIPFLITCLFPHLDLFVHQLLHLLHFIFKFLIIILHSLNLISILCIYLLYMSLCFFLEHSILLVPLFEPFPQLYNLEIPLV